MKIRKSYYFMFVLDTKTNKSFSVKKATMKKAMNYAKSNFPALEITDLFKIKRGSRKGPITISETLYSKIKRI